MAEDEATKTLESRADQVIVLIIPDEEYREKILDITKELSNLTDKICYISLNRPYGTLIQEFKRREIDLKKFYFIDAITQTAETTQPSPNCEFVSSPGALTELSLSISNILDKKEVNYLIFDSLSTLLVYENEMIVTKFIHSLMAKIRVVGCNAVFTCLEQDKGSVLIKDINMFSDRILNVKHWGLK